MRSRRRHPQVKPIAALRTLVPPASVLLIAFATAALRSGPRSVPVHVRLSLVESPLEQSQLDRCEIASELEKGQSATWCFLYGEAQPGEAGGWEALRARAGYEAGGCGKPFSSRRWSLYGSPYLLTEVTVRQRPPKGHGEQIELSITRRKLSGFSQKGEPSYGRIGETRVFSVEDAVTAAVPLLVADERERDAFRAHDVLLRFRAATAGRMPPAAYGEVSVLSDTPRADILLDGGVVARTSDEAPTLVKNVLAGQREVRVRDLSGREARKVVRIPKDKKIEVALNLREASEPAVGNGLIPLGTNPQGHAEYWRPKDGASVVKIPAGESLMGPAAGEGKPTFPPISSTRPRSRGASTRSSRRRPEHHCRSAALGHSGRLPGDRRDDPRGPATGRSHVVKGGSWDSRPSLLSASSRNFGYIGYREGDFGFRCAADPPSLVAGVPGESGFDCSSTR